MNPSDLCVFCATDDSFVRPLAVMLSSLLAAVPVRPINLAVALIDVSPVEVEKLRVVCDQPGVNAMLIPFDMSAYRSYPTCDTITTAAYARIFAPEILPSNWTKVLYLDCDLLIRKDVSQLWNVDLGPFALAAVEDPCCKQTGYLGMPPSATYVNSGVLIINLTLWRENDISQQLAKFISSRQAELQFHDQDALNACLHDKIMLLPASWNVMHSFFLEPWTRLVKLSRGQVSQLRADPAIVHFTGPTKPWKHSTAHPFQRAWHRALSRTPFQIANEEKPTLASSLIRLAKVFGRPVKRGIRVVFHLARMAIQKPSNLPISTLADISNRGKQ